MGGSIRDRVIFYGVNMVVLKTSDERESSSGFTLVELMVATALVSVLFFALATVYLLVDASWDRGEAMINLGRDGSYAVEEMAMSVRQAASVTIGSGPSITIKNAADSTVARYYLQASDSTLRDLSGNRIVPSKVDSLDFAQNGDIVDIGLVLTNSEGQRAYFNTSASLRN
jgi:prepilin-type N-terminal cleavage/methylation domain-containing protein